MKIHLYLLLMGTLVVSCQKSNKAKNHIFYLHGRIVEVQGTKAVSERFGPYEYDKIIEALNTSNTVIYNEVRTTRTVFQEFCEKVSQQIDSLVALGISPSNISVIGASKGAVMTMNISNINTNPINYVLLAANNDQIEQQNQWHLHGRVLGIYKKSDQLAGKNYNYWIAQSPDAVAFQQLEIYTNLGHGFLYQPLEAWLEPTVTWINQSSIR